MHFAVLHACWWLAHYSQLHEEHQLLWEEREVEIERQLKHYEEQQNEVYNATVKVSLKKKLKLKWKIIKIDTMIILDCLRKGTFFFTLIVLLVWTGKQYSRGSISASLPAAGSVIEQS